MNEQIQELWRYVIAYSRKQKHPILRAPLKTYEKRYNANSLYRWVQEVEEYGENAFPGNGTALADAQHKIKLLEKENRYLQEELELLKKFRVFLKRSK